MVCSEALCSKVRRSAKAMPARLAPEAPLSNQALVPEPNNLGDLGNVGRLVPAVPYGFVLVAVYLFDPRRLGKPSDRKDCGQERRSVAILMLHSVKIEHPPMKTRNPFPDGQYSFSALGD